MPELQRPTRNAADSNGPDADRAEHGGHSEATTRLDVAGADVAVSGDPTDAEAAALATVLAEHLRAEAEAAEADEEPRYAVDPWCLAGRLGRRTPGGVPTACRSGREWKTADRATTW
ncbi:hypothetical protein ACFQE8_20645 [Salinirubellus sp. GCM10025818]|jgi:hypothetical protein|uniref:hypothetical protein n=1 Tax=Salinirubellus TaxID=2162630 RepID=UPI0030D0490D